MQGRSDAELKHEGSWVDFSSSQDSSSRKVAFSDGPPQENATTTQPAVKEILRTPWQRPIAQQQGPGVPRSLLPQVRLLVISMFDGIGAIWLALQGIFDTIGFSFEIDPSCLLVLHHRFPKVTHMGDCNKVHESWFTDILAQFNPTHVLLGGGSPCQQLSSLSGSKLGLHGEDSKLFWVFEWACKVLQEACKLAGIVFFFLLENVIMERTFMDTISACLEVEPIILNAAFFGWHRRRRLVWFNWQLQDEAWHWLQWMPELGCNLLKVPHSKRQLPPLWRQYSRARTTQAPFHQWVRPTSRRADLKLSVAR